MVKKLKTFHTSEFPVCSFCKTWRFFTATSKQPLDYSKFVKYQPKYLKSCTQFLSQLSFLQREMLGDFYCRVYNWSKPPIATPRKCMYCAFTCINSKHFIHHAEEQWISCNYTDKLVCIHNDRKNRKPVRHAGAIMNVLWLYKIKQTSCFILSLKLAWVTINALQAQLFSLSHHHPLRQDSKRL